MQEVGFDMAKMTHGAGPAWRGRSDRFIDFVG